jgi:hypothetical protein
MQGEPDPLSEAFDGVSHGSIRWSGFDEVAVVICVVGVKSALTAFRQLLADDVEFILKLIIVITTFADNGESFHGLIRGCG